MVATALANVFNPMCLALIWFGTVLGIIDTRLWGRVLLWTAALLTVWSMVYYLRRALPEIRARA